MSRGGSKGGPKCEKHRITFPRNKGYEIKRKIEEECKSYKVLNDGDCEIKCRKIGECE